MNNINHRVAGPTYLTVSPKKTSPLLKHFTKKLDNIKNIKHDKKSDETQVLVRYSKPDTHSSNQALHNGYLVKPTFSDLELQKSKKRLIKAIEFEKAKKNLSNQLKAWENKETAPSYLEWQNNLHQTVLLHKKYLVPELFNRILCTAFMLQSHMLPLALKNFYLRIQDLYPKFYPDLTSVYRPNDLHLHASTSYIFNSKFYWLESLTLDDLCQLFVHCFSQSCYFELPVNEHYRQWFSAGLRQQANNVVNLINWWHEFDQSTNYGLKKLTANYLPDKLALMIDYFANQYGWFNPILTSDKKKFCPVFFESINQIKFFPEHKQMGLLHAIIKLQNWHSFGIHGDPIFIKKTLSYTNQFSIQENITICRALLNLITTTNNPAFYDEIMHLLPQHLQKIQANFKKRIFKKTPIDGLDKFSLLVNELISCIDERISFISDPTKAFLVEIENIIQRLPSIHQITVAKAIVDNVIVAPEIQLDNAFKYFQDKETSPYQPILKILKTVEKRPAYQLITKLNQILSFCSRKQLNHYLRELTNQAIGKNKITALKIIQTAILKNR